MARWGNRARRERETTARTGDQQAAAVMAQVRPLIKVVTAQLHDVVSHTQDAAITMLTDIQQTDDEAEALSGLARDLAVQSGRNSLRVAETTRQSAEQVDKMVVLVTERYGSVLGLVEDVRGLQTYAEAIAAVSHATNILALNAKIEAARAGEAGHAFGVVADEVRALSIQSTAAVEDIRNWIARVGAVMADRLGEDGGSSESSFGSISSQLRSIATQQHDVAEMLNSTIAGTQTAVEQIEASAGSLSRRTNALIGRVQFQDITRQSVESIVGALGGLDSRLSAIDDYLRDPDNAQLLHALGDALQDISASYVSQRQHAVHASTTSGGSTVAAATGPAIELF